MKNVYPNKSENSLEILLMTAPTDLVQVLVRNLQLCDRVRVHLVGGWTEKARHWDENGQVISKLNFIFNYFLKIF